MKFYINSDINYPKELSKTLRQIRKELGDNYTKPFLSLHLTYIGCEGADLNLLKERITAVAKNLKPIDIEIVGVGNIGTDLVYLKVRKNARLSKINRFLYDSFPKGCKVSNHWRPKNYAPHLTLMYGVKDRKTLNKILTMLKPVKFPIKAELTHIGIRKYNPPYFKGKPKLVYIVKL